MTHGELGRTPASFRSSLPPENVSKLIGMDCLFCRIAAGEIPAQKLYEDEDAIAFQDIQPQAPVHVVLIPRKHIASLAHLSPGDERLIGHMHVVAKKLAEEKGLDGFRTVVNTGNDGGQTIHHLHMHLLGGRPMHWPPG
jgi:histidine triad (HIT) family protein